ncbi:MAG: hypothetical protein J6Q89_03450 [Clostridia bacterium]|nr:hypothetical protein [Clostridia bacterium]
MKVLSLILCALLLFSLVACGNDSDTSSDAFSNASSAVSSEASKAESSAVSDTSSAASSAVSDDSSVADSSDVSDESGEESEEDDEPVDYGTLFVGKATTAPVVDGEVGEKEYATSIKFDASKPYWSVDSTEGVEAYEVTLYISWDEENLYTAVEIGAGKPRTYGNTDYLQNRPYIFDRRHVMTALITGDPTDSRYASPEGGDWDWSAAANSKLGNEWTITAQPDGANISADHFGSLTKSEGYDYIVAVSKLDSEIYEQVIPWASLVEGASFEPNAGATIGLGFTACCEEVNIEDDEEPVPYACFGSGILNGKNFSKYVGLTLKD